MAGSSGRTARVGLFPLPVEGLLARRCVRQCGSQRQFGLRHVHGADTVEDGGAVASFVGETGLSGIYQMTEHWALRADYRVMAVSGVALATEQVAVSNFNTGLGYDTGGSVFYHGLFLGLDFAY